MKSKTKKIIGLPAIFCDDYFINLLKKKSAQNLLVELLRNNGSCFINKNPQNPALRLSSQKIAALIDCKKLVQGGATVIACPNISAQLWRAELQTELGSPVADMSEVLETLGLRLQDHRVFITGPQNSPKVHYIRTSIGTDRRIEWQFPDAKEANLALAFENASADLEKNTEECRQIILKLISEAKRKEASVIIPTCIRMCQFETLFKEQSIAFINIADLYAQDLLEKTFAQPVKPFKLGLVGGLGPAATVDLYDKIVRATPAKNDQDHIKVIVDQNPQIADRTKFLLEGGEDPTLALFNVCKNLELNGVDAILIPCNTAHAYIESIEPYLSIPIINMQQTCLESIRDSYGKNCIIGLMATDGTCKTRIYTDKAEQLGLKMVVPDTEYQKLVMSAIYGPKGVKAGFTDGVCKEELLAAARHLVKDKQASVLILGCTELPLILTEGADADIGKGLTAHIVDPTATIARKAVKLALKTES